MRSVGSFRRVLLEVASGEQNSGMLFPSKIQIPEFVAGNRCPIQNCALVVVHSSESHNAFKLF
jgi:hypothetical protein